MSRWYRESIKQGQTSPDYLAAFAVNCINPISVDLNRPLTILDVGCGSGEQFSNISNRVGLEKFSKKLGIEWSPSAVKKHQTKSIFDQVVHCESDRLPFADQEFDIVTSVENLEHLYAEDVRLAVEELKRVADYVILITPLPVDVINYQFLNREIAEASADVEALGFEEFMALEGAVHKSVVYPESMETAGFVYFPDNHGYYFARSSDIDTAKIKYTGMTRRPQPASDSDFRNYYLQVLQDSINIKV